MVVLLVLVAPGRFIIRVVIRERVHPRIARWWEIIGFVLDRVAYVSLHVLLQVRTFLSFFVIFAVTHDETLQVTILVGVVFVVVFFLITVDELVFSVDVTT
jgi:hypothetical protein